MRDYLEQTKNLFDAIPEPWRSLILVLFIPFCVILCFREVSCWFWKLNTVTSRLERLDEHLQALHQALIVATRLQREQLSAISLTHLAERPALQPPEPLNRSERGAGDRRGRGPGAALLRPSDLGNTMTDLRRGRLLHTGSNGALLRNVSSV